MTLDINFSNKVYEDHRWHSAGSTLGFHEMIKRYDVQAINVNGESQYNEALQRAAEVRPETLVRFRHMIHQPPGATKKTDDGMWKLPPAEWIQNVCVAHGYNQRRLYVLTDNEFSTDKLEVLRQYLNNEKERIRLAKAVGQRLAVMSFPTHWPTYTNSLTVRKWLSEGVFDDYFRVIASYQGTKADPRIICCPNAYFSTGNVDGVKNVVNLYQRFVEVTKTKPFMHVGEFAFASLKNGAIDAHGGWTKAKLSAAEMVKQTVDVYQKYLLPLGINAMYYTVGLLGGDEVLSFHVPPYVLIQLLDASSKARVSEPVPPPPPPPDPEPEPDDDTRISELVARVGTLETERDRQEVAIAELQNRVAKLENLLLSHAVKTSETYKKAG